MAKKSISDFPPSGKMVNFVTEFAIFLKTSKKNKLGENGFCMEEFQKYYYVSPSFFSQKF